MKSWGIYIIIAGILAIVLPHFNLQLKILMWAEGKEIVVGSFLILIGILLTVVGFKTEQR